MRNRRYCQTEEVFVRIILKGDFYISADELAKRAGVSRSTFYRHHRAVKHIIRDYENYIVRLYHGSTRDLVRHRVNPRQLYWHTLVFIAKHRRIFLILQKGGNRSAFTRIVEYLKPGIVSAARLPKNAARNYRIYTAEIVELLWRWGEAGFQDAEIDDLLSNILYLTKTVRVRLINLKN